MNSSLEIILQSPLVQVLLISTITRRLRCSCPGIRPWCRRGAFSCTSFGSPLSFIRGSLSLNCPLLAERPSETRLLLNPGTLLWLWRSWSFWRWLRCWEVEWVVFVGRGRDRWRCLRAGSRIDRQWYRFFWMMRTRPWLSFWVLWWPFWYLFWWQVLNFRLRWFCGCVRIFFQRVDVRVSFRLGSWHVCVRWDLVLWVVGRRCFCRFNRRVLSCILCLRCSLKTLLFDGGFPCWWFLIFLFWATLWCDTFSWFLFRSLAAISFWDSLPKWSRWRF